MMSSAAPCRLYSVQVGRVAPLGPEAVPSGFVKRSVAAAVAVEALGLVGDEQADRSVHGGPDKAVYAYPLEHYQRWREAVPQHAALLVPGGFGENLTTEGLDEDGVAIGDVFRVGGASLEVTQPRQPCFKLALRFADPRMVRAMVRSGLTGWYLRVVEPGPVAPGNAIALMRRPSPHWTIARFNRLINGGGGTAEELAELAELPGLARHWQRVARQSLASSIG
jgi:MOSC domain-containing protein YiiM